MKPENIFDWIRVDEFAATPKYLQLTNSILKAIETGKIRKNDLMPSIPSDARIYSLGRKRRRTFGEKSRS